MALALFAAYGISSTAFAELVGDDMIRVADNAYVPYFEPPGWLLLLLYGLGGLFACAGAVAAVGAVLRACGDATADRTVRWAIVALPLAAAAAVLTTIAFA